MFLLFFTLDGEVLEPNLPHFGASFKGPPKVGSKTSPQELPGERSWNLGGSLGDPLGRPGAPLGAFLGPLETPLEPLWAHLGTFGELLGSRRVSFGSLWELL